MILKGLTVQDDWIAGTDRGIGIMVTKASWLANRQAQRAAQQSRQECPHEPRCNSKDWCLTLVWKEEQGWIRLPSGEWVQREAS